MKPSIVTLLAAASIAFMLALPAHAQWVASNAIPTPGIPNNPNSYANYSPGASASSTGPGATVSGGTFECNFSTSGTEPANSGCNADAGYGGSWVITYTWQGSGTGPSFVLPIQAEAHGLTSFSGTAGGGCGADTDGYYNTSGNTSFNDPTKTFDTNPMSGTSPTLTVTISGSAGGNVPSTPVGGSFQTSAEADVMVGVPIY